MSRRSKSDAVAACINFCKYYKPGKSEELQCQGFVVVQKLMAGGKALSLERRGNGVVPNAPTIEGLKGRVCAGCQFRAADCDFILTGGIAPPCGGFALLSQLLGSGELSLDEIEK